MNIIAPSATPNGNSSISKYHLPPQSPNAGSASSITSPTSVGSSGTIASPPAAPTSSFLSSSTQIFSKEQQRKLSKLQGLQSPVAATLTGSITATTQSKSQTSYDKLKANVRAKHKLVVNQLQELYLDKIREQYFLQHGGSIVDFASTGDTATAQRDNASLQAHLVARRLDSVLSAAQQLSMHSGSGGSAVSAGKTYASDDASGNASDTGNDNSDKVRPHKVFVFVWRRLYGWRTYSYHLYILILMSCYLPVPYFIVYGLFHSTINFAFLLRMCNPCGMNWMPNVILNYIYHGLSYTSCNLLFKVD